MSLIPVGDRRLKAQLATPLFTFLLIAAAFLSLMIGAVSIPVEKIPQLLFSATQEDAQMAAIISTIRLPRLLLGLAVGAALGLTGSVMQTLFRNPLADPALLGLSSGAALAAVGVIVLGHHFAITSLSASGLEPFAVPLAAFLGALVAITCTLSLGSRQSGFGVGALLLAGVAVNALCNTGIGLMIYIADDQQLRQLTFWTLGSLAAANWFTALPALAVTLLAACWILPKATALNLLTLGEAEAANLGVQVKPLKLHLIIASSLTTGAAVAACGIIGFVGLVVPHLIRLLCGPDHRIALPVSMLLGASLTIGADLIGRTVVAPSELPIGLVCGALGAPFLLWLLRDIDRTA